MGKIRYEEYTEIGGRDKNEDCYAVFSCKAGYVFVVADGLGGHGFGDIASKCVCDGMKKYYEGVDRFTREVIDNSYAYCQEILINKQWELGAVGEMLTTVCMMCIDEERIFISHIGDSRVYRIKENEEIWHTRDHTLAQMMVIAGEINEKDIRGCPERNRLTRALGARNSAVRIEIKEDVACGQNCYYMLCTDGFWDLITEEEMTEIFKKKQCIHEIMREMLRVVHSNEGDTDNKTVILVSDFYP